MSETIGVIRRAAVAVVLVIAVASTFFTVRGGESPAGIQNQEDKHMHSERYERGLEMLRRIDGAAGENVVASLEDIAPDFATYLLEYPFGDIYSRPGLDLKSREIAVVSALTALGNARPQLKVHIGAALNVGCSREEIVETIMMMSVYAGFPAALNGLSAAREVFAEHAD